MSRLIRRRRDLKRLEEMGFIPDEQTKKKSKYGNVKTKVDGWTFDSKLEADCYRHLRRLMDTGQIKFFLCQVPFRLPGHTIYRADFLVVYNDNQLAVIDAKGKETDAFKIKKRLLEEAYPVEIELWRGV